MDRNNIDTRLKPNRYAFAVGYFHRQELTLSEGMRGLLIKLMDSIPEKERFEYIAKGKEIIEG